MKKRLLSLILAAILLVALVAGCAGKESTAPETPAEPAETVEESKAPAAEAETEAPEAPETDEPAVEGEEAQEPQQEESTQLPPLSYPLTEEKATLTYWQAWPPFLSTFCSPDENETFARLEEVTNVHLDMTVVDTETQSEKFNLMVAADECTDIMQGASKVYNGGTTKAIEDEVLVDLWPYVPEYMPDYYNHIMEDESIRRYMLDDEGQMGQIYGIYSEPFYMDQGNWIRQDFLDKVGLKMPNTLEEMETVLEAFKTELGVKQPVVLLANSPQLDFLSTAYEAGTLAIDGKLVDNSLGENMKNYYKKMHEWFEKGYIYSDFMDNTYSQTKPPQDCVYEDEGGLYKEDVASISTYIQNHTDPNFELRAVPQIKLTADQELHNCKIPYLVSEKYAMSISTHCEGEKLRLAMGMLNYFFTPDGEILGNFGIEGNTFYYKDDGEPMFTDFVMNHKLGMQGAQSAFINPGIPCLVDLSVNELTYNDAQKEAVDVWISNFDGYEESVPNYSLTTEESTTVATIQTDIQTYIEEMNLMFIMGEADIDATWDEYVATIKSLGYDTVQEVNQAAFERYLAK